jgi:hypothetical protein
MARRQVATVIKKDEDKLKYRDEKGNLIREFYIKFSEDVTFKKGDRLWLENKQLKKASLEANREKMSEETYKRAIERIENMPGFVAFEAIKVTDN